MRLSHALPRSHFGTRSARRVLQRLLMDDVFRHIGIKATAWNRGTPLLSAQHLADQPRPNAVRCVGSLTRIP